MKQSSYWKKKKNNKNWLSGRSKNEVIRRLDVTPGVVATGIKEMKGLVIGTRPKKTSAIERS
jgi:hypothetical protein